MRFLRDKQASISLEMVGIFSLFVLLIMLASDMGSLLVTKNKIDKLSYSLASIIRERTQLYQASPLDKKQAHDLYEFAQALLHHSLSSPFGLVIESLGFDAQGEPIITSLNEGSYECELKEDIQSLQDLSFETSFGRIGLYRVSICVDLESNFVPIATNWILNKPISSSVVFSR